MRWHSQPRKREKEKLERKPGQKEKEKGKGSGGSRRLGSQQKGKAAKAAGRKGPTNGVTEGSSGSRGRHAQREKQPGQRLTHSLSSEISDSGNERTNKRKSGVTPDKKQQTNKKGKGEAQAPEESLHERCLVTLGGYAGLKGKKGEKGRRCNLLRWESRRTVCGRPRRIRRDEGMGLKGTKTQRHRWIMARLRDSRWARPSSVAQRKRKGREEQRSSVKRCGSKTESLLDQNVESWGASRWGNYEVGGASHSKY